jgi:hypothetical protein
MIGAVRGVSMETFALGSGAEVSPRGASTQPTAGVAGEAGSADSTAASVSPPSAPTEVASPEEELIVEVGEATASLALP